jgi:hypothetical protein
LGDELPGSSNRYRSQFENHHWVLTVTMTIDSSPIAGSTRPQIGSAPLAVRVHRRRMRQTGARLRNLTTLGAWTVGLGALFAFAGAALGTLC